MKKGTNFDISLTRTETLYLLKPDKYGKVSVIIITSALCVKSTVTMMIGWG